MAQGRLKGRVMDFAIADLRGKLDFGPLHFQRAEWWSEAPRFALLRFTLNGSEQELGLRLDLDKRAIIDRLDDERLNRELTDNAHHIWDVVAQGLRKPSPA
jgi:hypothetical protein